MPQEHSGGLDRNGLSTISVEWHEDQPFAVEITHFDFDALDSLEDRAREALAAGRLEKFLNEYAIARLEEVRRHAIDALITEVIHADQPKMKLVFIAIAIGSMAGMEKTMEEWGTDFGVSKQDIQQGVERMAEQFELRKNRTMRDEEARARMQASNFRPKEQVMN